MAIIKAINSKASIGRAIEYITKKEKTEDYLTYGKDCNPNTVIDEMKITKEMWGKTDGRQYVHLVQSFDPKDNINFEKAHELGKELINNFNKYKGHEVLMVTHLDKEHVHNHFIINSVNYENGRKINTSSKELQSLKDYSNKLSREHGLTVPIKGDSITTFSQKKYKVIEKGFKKNGNSYLLETAKAVSSSLKNATDRESFIKEMNVKGYKVNWKDSRKNITFENSDGKKVRSSNLEKTFKDIKFSKEGIENEIQRNRERNTRGSFDWSAVRDNVQSEGNGISEQFSNEITRNIQQKVREVKERTQRAVGEGQSTDREIRNVKSNSDKGIEFNITKDTTRVKGRVRELTR